MTPKKLVEELERPQAGTTQSGRRWLEQYRQNTAESLV